MEINSTFSSFSVNDVPKAKDFYQNVLKLVVSETPMGGLDLKLADGAVYLYPKKDHQPANFTVLNFEVENIDEVAKELAAAGVKFEHYDGLNQDENGIARGRKVGRGPDIAWFKDPAGNILAVLQN